MTAKMTVKMTTREKMTQMTVKMTQLTVKKMWMTVKMTKMTVKKVKVTMKLRIRRMTMPVVKM